MSSEQDRRSAVVCGLRAGRSAKEIAEFHHIPLRTVYDIKKRFDEAVEEGVSPEEVSSARSAHKRRSDRLDSEFVGKVQAIIDADPGRSMRSISRELNISEWSVRRIVDEDIRYHSYALRRGQFISVATKQRRLEKAKLLLNRLKNPRVANQLIFFSDEKNFSQDQVANRRNNRWLCSDPSEVPVVMATKFPATVMVLGVVSNEGDVMPPHFFPKGLRLTADAYIGILETVVKPWMDRVAGGRHYVFQQDGAPAHNASATQDWLRQHLPEFWEKEVWPPSSPDCNPLDYFVWSVCERDTNKHPHNNVESLKQKIEEVMANLRRETVSRACQRFRARIEAVIRAEGGFFE